MTCDQPGCQGHYDFTHIALMAKKRFVDGIDTISLMQQANSERERQEIALVALLNVEEQQIKEIQLACPYALSCQVLNCQQHLRTLLKPLLEQHHDDQPPLEAAL
mgnify:CR=1 FL=1|jgi:hypothetical protein